MPPKFVQKIYSIWAGNQTIRIKRICSTEENLGFLREQLKLYLVARGHEEDQVESEIERVH